MLLTKNIVFTKAFLLLDIDFWSEIGSESQNVDFMVDPMNLDRISYYLAYHGVDFEVLIDDVQSAIDNEETGE